MRLRAAGVKVSAAVLLAPTVWPVTSAHPPPQRPLPPPTTTPSPENQQICNLPAVMNGGLLQPRLPPRAQMDDCGQLKCFLRRAGGRRTQGKVATGDAPTLFIPLFSL